MITALVERWHTDTSTFHLYHGEVTITLEDMHFLIGLSVDGELVESEQDLQKYVETLLGKKPDGADLSGGRVKMTWLRSHFGTIRGDADEETVEQHCRAYIMDFFGSCIFADLSGAYAHLFFLPLLEDMSRIGEYAWGAATLSWLYRELGHCAFRVKSSPSRDRIGDIGGLMALIQAWELERFTSIVCRVHKSRQIALMRSPVPRMPWLGLRLRISCLYHIPVEPSSMNDVVHSALL
ncbi:Protein MAIN-LIKE 2 [Linum perenne]